MVKQFSRPIATLYVYKLKRRVVSISLGHVPPEPDFDWDTLTRIPVVANGSRPTWRAFTCRQDETISHALGRSRWPQED